MLKEKVDELREEGKELYCGLVFDEMALCQHVQWLDDKKSFSGFVTFGKVGEDIQCLPIATEALVFLLSGINIPFNLPIAFYFIAKLEGIDKVILISSILKSLTEIGVKVLTITFDGLPSNTTACEILGCSFEINDFRTYFRNPDDGSKVHVTLDPPHMYKLIRKYLGNHRTIHDKDGRVIEWRLIEKLVEMRDKENFITHKLTRKHLDYFGRNGMKVSTAVETLSNSVAKSIQFLLDQKYPGFENAQGTIEFISRMDKLFDILNSEIQPGKSHLKNPITVETKAEIFAFLDETAEYIKKLSLKPFGTPMIASASKVGLKGMLINIENIKSIYTEFVETGILDHFSSRRICQCPLESLFSRCRSHSMLGSNTKPTAFQFRSLFRKILINNEITGSVFGNCIDNLDILQLSSNIPKRTTYSPNNMQEVEMLNYILDTPPEIEQDQINPHIEMELGPLYNISEENVGVAYVAGLIEKNTKSNTKNNCELCANVFTENEKLSGGLPIQNFGNPCRSTFEICTLAHQVLDLSILTIDFNYNNTVTKILEDVQFASIFSHSDFSHDHTHKYHIAKYIIEEYIRIRATEIAKKVSLDNKMKRLKEEEKQLKKNRKK